MSFLKYCHLTLSIYLSYLTANTYLTTSLSKIIQRLSWTSDISGILLLNIGNGIPDLISSLILSKDDTFCMISSSIGSFIVLLTLALPMIILFSKIKTFLSFFTFYKNLFAIMASFSFYIYILASECVNFNIGMIMLATYGIFLYYSFYVASPVIDTIEHIIIEDSERKNVFKRLTGFINIPFKIILDFCLLNLNNKTRYLKNHYYGIISPSLNLCLSILFFKYNLTYKYFGILIGLAVLLGIFLSYSLKNDKNNLIIYLYSFFMSCAAMYLFTTLIVDFIYYLHQVNKIPKELLSLLIMSLGNCIGDIMTGISVSRKGLFKTSASACLTAPVHNTLFNLGIIFIVQGIKNNFKNIEVKYNSILHVAMALVPLICINLILNYEIRNRKLAAELAFVLLFIYSIFIYFTFLQSISNS